MKQVLVYADSLSWGIVPSTRRRLDFDQRWPGVLEAALLVAGQRVRVIEDCLNGRRTVWDDPFKPGRNGLVGLAQRIELNSPLALVVLMLGTNDFQSMHPHNAWLSGQGIAALVAAIRTAPIEPGMPVPPILVVAPPPITAPSGPIAPKFEGGGAKCVGLAEAYAQVCRELGCAFFDAGSVASTSPIDGVHLDADQHAVLGQALCGVVGRLLRAPVASAAPEPAAAAVLYAKDLQRVAAFYTGALGLVAGPGASDHMLLNSAALQLTLVQIPAHIAAEITISSPPQRRDDTPIKLAFDVERIAGARAAAAALGGGVDPAEREWVFGSFRVCDGHDPEGNVVQLRQRVG